MSDSVTQSIYTDPNQVWQQLDSFWRTCVTASDAELVRFQTLAILLSYDTYSRSLYRNISEVSNITTLAPTTRVAWLPIIVYQDMVLNRSYRTYGSGDVFAAASHTFGEAGPTRWEVHTALPLIQTAALCDSVTDTSYVFDKSVMSVANGVITLAVDLFSTLTAKVDGASGRNYVVLWCKNAELDNKVLADWVGWTLQFNGDPTRKYAAALQALHEMTTLGFSVGRFEKGIGESAGIPAVTSAEIARNTLNDGWRKHVITDSTCYSHPSSLSTTVTVGSLLHVGQSISSAVQVKTGSDVTAMSFSELPGIVLNIQLSTGRVVPLSFINSAGTWSYGATRPSPWRFSVGGDAADVEQFWVDSWAKQQASGVYLSSVYGLVYPGTYAVTPMQVILRDVAGSNSVAILVGVATDTGSMVEFIDRSAGLIPDWAIRVIQQVLSYNSDTVSPTTYGETVACGYGASITDTFSPSGPDLTLLDYTPLVTVT